MLCKLYIFLIFSMLIASFLALPIPSFEDTQSESSFFSNTEPSFDTIPSLASSSVSELSSFSNDALSDASDSPLNNIPSSFPSSDSIPPPLSEVPLKSDSDTLTPEVDAVPFQKLTNVPPEKAIPSNYVGEIPSDDLLSNFKKTELEPTTGLTAETILKTESGIKTETDAQTAQTPVTFEKPDDISKVSKGTENEDAGNDLEFEDSSSLRPNARMDEEGFDLDDIKEEVPHSSFLPPVSAPSVSTSREPIHITTKLSPSVPSVRSAPSTPSTSFTKSSFDSTLRSIPSPKSSAIPRTRSIFNEATDSISTTQPSSAFIPVTTTHHSPSTTPSNRRADEGLDFDDDDDDETDPKSSIRPIQSILKSTLKPSDNVDFETSSPEIHSVHPLSRTRRHPSTFHTQTQPDLTTNTPTQTDINDEPETFTKPKSKSKPSSQPPRISSSGTEDVSDTDVTTELDSEQDTDTGTKLLPSSSSSITASTSSSSSIKPTRTSKTMNPSITLGSSLFDSSKDSKLNSASVTDSRDVEDKDSFLNHLDFSDKQKAPTNRLNDQAVNPNASGEASCGNGFCEVGETCDNCPLDCASIVSSFVVRCNLGIQRCHSSFKQKTVVLKVIQNPSLPLTSDITTNLPSEWKTKIVPDSVKRQLLPFLQPSQDLKLLTQHPGVRSLSYIGYHNNVTSAVQFFTREGFELVPVDECLFGRSGPFLKWEDAFHFDLYEF